VRGGVFSAVVAALVIAIAPSAAARTETLPRATADRADEITGPQVHAMYVLPSDGDDRELDTDGTIAASVANFQTWLEGETGGRGLRLDTYQGELDVTFFVLDETDAQMAARGVFMRDALEAKLHARGFDAPGKIYAVYYDGSNTAACGGGAWPPTLPGDVGALYLRATYGGGLNCYDPSASLAGLQIMDFAMLHELVHTLGFVPTCAPHHTRSGHVSDDTDDLMWAGDGFWTPSTLDVGRDDYYDSGVAGCADLAQNPYLQGPPTAVTVASVTARARHAGTLVTWHAPSPETLLGFNVWRAAARNAPYLRVNTRLIPALPAQRVRYRLLDRRSPTRVSRYRVEAVGVDGGRSWSASVAAR
jgi:hypothetical protein